MLFDDPENLRRALRSESVIPAQIAKAAGLQPGTLYSFIEGRTAHMRADTKKKVIDALLEMYPQLFGDDGNFESLPDDSEKPNSGPGLIAEKVVAIPVYDIRASAGAGALVAGDEVKTVHPFLMDHIRRLTDAPIRQITGILVSGDSMFPNLRDGDLILLDRTVNRIARDGIYVLEIEGELLVKRCQINLENGKIDVISDNQAYRSYSVGRDRMILIVGRVFWHGGGI